MKLRGLEVFVCDRLHGARLTPKGCADLWRAHQRPQDFPKPCATCPDGERRAGGESKPTTYRVLAPAPSVGSKGRACLRIKCGCGAVRTIEKGQWECDPPRHCKRCSHNLRKKGNWARGLPSRG